LTSESQRWILYFCNMDIRKSLMSDPGKENARRISDYIGDDPVRMKELMLMFLKGSFRENQRAAYPVIYITDRAPEMLKPYLSEMIAFMTDDVHDAVIRNTMRLFQNIDLPEEVEGLVYDKAFRYLSSPKYAIAIRAFSMTVLANICVKYPELKIEVIPLIQDVLEVTESSGIKARGKNILKMLAKT
jgi:hypothetical protein